MPCPQCSHCFPKPKCKVILFSQRWTYDLRECNWEVKPMSSEAEAWISLENTMNTFEKENKGKIIDIGMPNAERYYSGGIVSYAVTLLDN